MCASPAGLNSWENSQNGLAPPLAEIFCYSCSAAFGVYKKTKVLPASVAASRRAAPRPCQSSHSPQSPSFQLLYIGRSSRVLLCSQMTEAGPIVLNKTGPPPPLDCEFTPAARTVSSPPAQSLTHKLKWVDKLISDLPHVNVAGCFPVCVCVCVSVGLASRVMEHPLIGNWNVRSTPFPHYIRTCGKLIDEIGIGDPTATFPALAKGFWKSTGCGQLGVPISIATEKIVCLFANSK